MKEQKRAAGRPKKLNKRAEILNIRLQPLEKKAFSDAASVAGLDLSAWVRERLRRAAIRELENVAMPIPFLKALTGED